MKFYKSCAKKTHDVSYYADLKKNEKTMAHKNM